MGSGVGRAGTCVSKCRLVVGMPVIAALSFLQCQLAEAATAVPQQACHRSESLFISFCGLLKTAWLLVHGC